MRSIIPLPYPFHTLILFLAISLVSLAGSFQTAAAVSSAAAFRVPNPQELAMASEPAAAGASAIILYREVYRDDSGHIPHEDDYYRIKILTDEGRKYADVEIPFFRESENITGVHARTIKPDGSIVEYDGKVFTKTVVKAKGVKYLAKTFSLPAVQAGCVIEYYYTDELAENWLFDSHWILSHELFTKAVKFSLKPYTNDYWPYHLRWNNRNIPSASPLPKEGPDHVIRLETGNIAAFPTEDYMPPANELKARVDFTYSLDAPDTNAGHFWARVGKRLDDRLESFVGKRKAMEEAVAATVGPNDPPEVKLQKLYARVQQLRNTSYEVQKTEEEEKRAKEKAPENAEEVWKRGYGSGQDLTWLYLALVRAAGFDAYGVMVADRERYFFDPNGMESGRLDGNLVLINLNGKQIFCDPGAAFTPFGLLPWPETGIQGLKLDKKESAWIPGFAPTSAQAHTERRANLTLTETGDLEGTLSVTFTGLEAVRLRLEERNADETERKSYLQDIIKGYIPAAAEVTLANQPDWKSSSLPLVAEVSLKVPGWASAAGRHVILPAGLFSAHEKHTFDHAERVHPIYFEYPFAELDDINVTLPLGWQISSLPEGREDTGRIVTYALKAGNDKGNLHLSRSLTVEFILLETKYYPALRQYFQIIKATDEQQVVLEAGGARGGK